MKIRKLIKHTLQNIHYLFTHHLPSEMAGLTDENLKYEIRDAMNNLYIPRIKDVMQTLQEIVDKKISFTRFGDGEFELLLGNSISFQQASIELSNRLKEILSSTYPHIGIGIPSILYTSKENLCKREIDFWHLYGQKFRQTIAQYTAKSHTYYSAECTLAFTLYLSFDYEKYFNLFRQIWDKRPITLICGKGISDNLDHNIFDNAASICWQYAPKCNAFESYQMIFKQALSRPKGELIITILGPTATVLAYDLALQGYQALDLGHIAKAWDWYQKTKNQQKMPTKNFFSPD